MLALNDHTVYIDSYSEPADLYNMPIILKLQENPCLYNTCPDVYILYTCTVHNELRVIHRHFINIYNARVVAPKGCFPPASIECICVNLNLKSLFSQAQCAWEVLLCSAGHGLGT